MDAVVDAAEAVVIGCRGFVGSRVVTAMERAGVRVAGFNRDVPFLRPDGALARVLRGAPIVCYLATTITPATTARYPERASQERRLFCRLLDSLQAASSGAVVLLASSGGTVYDVAAPPPYQESAPVGPGSAYGRAKLRLEQELLARTGLTPVILRLSNVYGPGQRVTNGQGVIGHWLQAVRTGQPVRVFGDAAAVRDYVYCDDVADAILTVYRLAMQSADLPAILNVGSGQPTSLKELLGLLPGIVGHDVPAEFAPGRRFDRQDVWLDVTLAERSIGWRPRTPLPAGLARTWAAGPE